MNRTVDNVSKSERKYYFIRQSKIISYICDGSTCEFIPPSQLQKDTLSKMVEGLNHFLEYLNFTEPETYDYVGRYVFKKWLSISQDYQDYLANNYENYAQERERLIEKHFTPDETIIHAICRYVSKCSKNDAEDKKATTDITLTNVDCNILHVMSVIIKFSFLFVAFIRGDIKFEDCVAKHMNSTLYKIISIIHRYHDYSHIDYNPDDVHAKLDYILDEIYRQQWTKNTNAFQRKFDEVGRDVVKLSQNNKVKIFTSLRKYVPALEDLENPKYTAKYSKDELNKKYWTIADNWDDFVLVNKAMTSYIQATTREICLNQDAKITIANVNIPDFLQDASDETSLQREHAMYHDKKKFMYERTADTVIDIIKDVKLELEKLDASKDIHLSIVGKFSISKEHTINKLILNKILLALTGDSRVYIDHLGLLAKFILYLFYLKVARDENLTFFRPIIQAMVMKPVGTCTYPDDALQDMLTHLDVKDLSLEAYKELVSIHMDDNNMHEVPYDNMIDFYIFLSNPSRVRNLLFPDKFDVIDDDEVNNITYNISNNEKITFDKVVKKLNDNN